MLVLKEYLYSHLTSFNVFLVRQRCAGAMQGMGQALWAQAERRANSET